MFHDFDLNLHNSLLDSSVVSLLRYELYQSNYGCMNCFVWLRCGYFRQVSGLTPAYANAKSNIAATNLMCGLNESVPAMCAQHMHHIHEIDC